MNNCKKRLQFFFRLKTSVRFVHYCYSPRAPNKPRCATEYTYLFPWLISNLMHKIRVYLHIIHLLKSSTCFEHYSAHLQEVYVVTVYMQPLVSSLSAGDCLVHRLRKNPFLNGAQDSHLQRVTIPEAAYTYDVNLLKTSRIMLETCRGS